MSVTTTLGIALYVMGAVAWSLVAVAKAPPVTFTFTKPPTMSDVEAKRAQRVGHAMLIVGMHVGIIACSLVWPLFVVSALRKFRSDDDEDGE